MTNQQQQTPQQTKNDDFNEYLEELNQQLDEIEEQQYQDEYQKELKRRRNEKQKQEQKKQMKTVVVITGCIAASIIAGSFVVISRTNTGYDPDIYDPEPYEDIQAVALYDLSYTQGFTIADKTYSYDSTLQDFLDDGWVVQEYNYGEKSGTLEEYDSTSVRLTKDNKEIANFDVQNRTSHPVAMEDASISNIYVYDDDFEVVMPLQIKLGMSQDEIEQILKDNGAVYTIDNDSYRQLSVDMYGYDEEAHSGKSVSIDIGFDDDNKAKDIYYYIYNNGYSQVITSS